MKVTRLMTLFVFLCALASCSGKKNWTCVCNNQYTQRANVIEYEDMKKKDAEAKCKTHDKTYPYGNGTNVVETCGLE